MNGLAMKAALVGEAVFLFSGSSVVAFKFPRELASREFIEKLGEKHGRGGKKTDNNVYSHMKTASWEINEDGSDPHR